MKPESHAQAQSRLIAWVDGLRQDLGHAARGLARTPGFTALATLSLGLGIGLTCALFSVVDAVLLRPLPLPDPHRLVHLAERRGEEPSGGSPARLRDWAQSPAVASVAGSYGEGIVLTGDPPERVTALRTFGPFLRTLGVRPAIGRAPTAAEEDGRAATVALLAHGFWVRRFGGDPGVVGRVIRCGDQAFEVIGVLPPEASYPNADMWAPASAQVQATPRSAGFLDQIAQLADGMDVARAQAAFDVQSAALASRHPDSDRDLRITVAPLETHISREARLPLLTLLAAMGAVLLVACVNVGGLLVARGIQRRREAAVRLALGAGRVRLIRLFLTEALLLGLLCCVAGVAAAALLVDVLITVLPADTPRLAEAALDHRSIAVAVGLSITSTLLAALLPAWHAGRSASAADLRDGGRTTTERGRARVQSALVVAQIAVSLVLLLAGTTLASGLARMTRLPLGFVPDQAIGLSLPLGWDTPKGRVDAISTRVLDAIRSVPGVSDAGLVDRLPLGGGSETAGVSLRGDAPDRRREAITVAWRTASAGYFRAAGVELRAGAFYRDGDTAPVALVNERFAKTFLRGEVPIGKEIAFLGRDPVRDAERSWVRIVGVVADVRQDAALEPLPEVFLPWGSRYWPLLHVVVRTPVPLGQMGDALRRAVASVARELVFERVEPMPTYVASTRRPARVQTLLMSGFAAAAMLLTAVGLFAVLAADVSRRRGEFGIRLALGATPSVVARTAATRALRLVSAGAVLGLFGAWAAHQMLASALTTLGPADPVAIAVAVGLLWLAAAIATVGPARRAARVDPIQALRAE